LPSTLIVTPLGIGIGFFPIRDIDRSWLLALGSWFNLSARAAHLTASRNLFCRIPH
jgi:hypothetical protein